MTKTFTAIDGTVIVIDKVAAVGPVTEDGTYADCHIYYVITYTEGGRTIIGDELKFPRSRMESDRRDLLEAISA